MPFADLPGIRLFHTDDGPVSPAPGLLGVPTLAVHGWLGSSGTWLPQLDRLRRRCRTIAVDLRGHGRSAAPDVGYTKAEFVDDLVRLLDLLETGPVVVLAHSMGGGVAAALAVRHPDLVRALVMVDPDYAGAEDRETMREVAEALAGPDGAAVALGMLGSHGEDVRRTPAYVRARSFRENVFGAGATRLRPEADALLAMRTQPVLAFHRDPARADVERATAMHPASRVIVVGRTGHWIHEEHPDLVSSELERWLALVG